MTDLPKTYGDVLNPFDPVDLPDYLAARYVADLTFREWVDVFDRVQRAEKVSSWTEWSAEETAAFDNDDHQTFSRLRGYSEAEIGDFARYLQLSETLRERLGGEGLCLDAMVEIQRIVGSKAFLDVERRVLELSDTAPAEPSWSPQTLRCPVRL